MVEAIMIGYAVSMTAHVAYNLGKAIAEEDNSKSESDNKSNSEGSKDAK